ncbi:tocopherol cyclase family protein [Leptolyngbya sp. FACHB-16]|uniref:tocopherol cyclase family protein n=1 Tax=unclassified Leptolyngbya TaxID=2650499 RepID=UPI0016865A25|nr:tocopherol cyclase family protein [Leptolyngbya sp. FACHB-16]MBD2156170.1 tocopherol cyclase family protein [Leptolyngbya sp. FACHB-16]
MASSPRARFPKIWLQPPHSGYHWDGSPRRFFEGWYFRLTLPEIQESFAFMYSLEDPSGDRPHSGGTAQILGPQESYFCRTLPDVRCFWTWPRSLGLGYWRTSRCSSPRYLPPDSFVQKVSEGFQVIATLHQGQLWDPASNSWVRWQYQVQPLDGWGERHTFPLATAGWLSYFPIFEPGWQVLMAHGLASGWIEWQGDRYDFTHAPTYAEKNWGGAFPEKWFWIQCNAFENESELSLTAVGSWRQVLAWREQVGLIGIHHHGRFYEFVPWNSKIAWRVEPWGKWTVWAESDRYRAEVVGWCDRPPAQVRVPTAEGMVFACQDTTHGHLTLKLWEGTTLILEAHTQSAGLEVGGGPWDVSWVMGDR